MNEESVPQASHHSGRLGNRFDRIEWAGAFGDFGTFIPFVVGYIGMVGVDPFGTLSRSGSRSDRHPPFFSCDPQPVFSTAPWKPFSTT